MAQYLSRYGSWIQSVSSVIHFFEWLPQSLSFTISGSHLAVSHCVGHMEEFGTVSR